MVSKTKARVATKTSAPRGSVKPTQVFDDRGNHCLVAQDGRRTRWAGYQQITMMDGWVGHTAFYGRSEGVVQPKEFCKEQAVSDLVVAPTIRA